MTRRAIPRLREQELILDIETSCEGGNPQPLLPVSHQPIRTVSVGFTQGRPNSVDPWAPEIDLFVILSGD